MDILTVLYHRILNLSPSAWADPDRDRYVQSKGHCVEALYVVLAGCGFFPEEDLQTICKYRSPYVGHPTRKIRGIEHNTGALGHGLSVAAGMALGLKMKDSTARVYTLMGDGELAEGSNWEAALFAAHQKLDNLTAIVDHNTLQITGATCDVLSLEPLADKWRAFGWEVSEVDGHAVGELILALDRNSYAPGKPRIVIANTIKGKGVSFMENDKKWHHKVPTDEELAAALGELGIKMDEEGVA
jgi:transketolase